MQEIQGEISVGWLTFGLAGRNKWPQGWAYRQLLAVDEEFEQAQGLLAAGDVPD